MNLDLKYLVIDNFYDNPIEVRNFALQQDYFIKQYHPGKRSHSFANIGHKNAFQSILKPFAGEIINFSYTGDNGSFQYTTSYDRSWVHIDGKSSNWAAIIYLTPNAPLSSGTGFYKFYDGTMNDKHQDILNNHTMIEDFSQDMTKWELIENTSNVFNRLIIYRANNFHMSMKYFGKDINDGRLFQVFFFSTKY